MEKSIHAVFFVRFCYLAEPLQPLPLFERQPQPVDAPFTPAAPVNRQSARNKVQ